MKWKARMVVEIDGWDITDGIREGDEEMRGLGSDVENDEKGLERGRLVREMEGGTMEVR